MPRRLNRRRLIFAALRFALAILPNFVHVYRTRVNPDPEAPFRQDNLTRPVVRVMFLYLDWFHFEAPSVERAKTVAYRWEQYHRWPWILAAAAGCIVVREILPIRLFGRDDDETL
jgi:hypothetical protein